MSGGHASNEERQVAFFPARDIVQISDTLGGQPT